MQSTTVRYQVLRNSEANVPAEPVVLEADVPPPSYDQSVLMGHVPDTQNAAMNNQAHADKSSFAYLPSYEAVSHPPPYEEVTGTDRNFLIESGEHDTDSESMDQAHFTVGSFSMFLLSFFVSFLFNWLGFLVCVCFCPSLASRYGALSGFGLSVMKWAAIVKHQEWGREYFEKQLFLWWIMLFLGFFMFARGIVQFIRVRREYELGLYNATPTPRRRFIYLF